MRHSRIQELMRLSSVVSSCAIICAACNQSDNKDANDSRFMNSDSVAANDKKFNNSSKITINKESGTVEVQAEELIKNPVEYLTNSQKNIANEIRLRTEKIDILNQRAKTLQVKLDKYVENLSEVENIERRFRSAISRAEDEGRWPIKIAGKSFDKNKANLIVFEMNKYIKNRSGIASEYMSLINSLKNSVSTCMSDIDNLNRMNEKIALDIEKLQLGKTLDDITSLKSRISEIGKLSDSIVNSESDSAIESLMKTGSTSSDIVDISEFIK